MRKTATIAAVCAALSTQTAWAQEPFLSVAVSDEYGQYIVGPANRPVYAFVTERRAGDDLAALESCNKPCRERWPPAFTAPDFPVADPLDPELTTTLKDQAGDVAVYNGEPLFYFVMDEAGAEPVGQGIHSFGGWWYLMSPDGAYIDTGITPELPD